MTLALSRQPRRRRRLWFERVMALLAVANLGLVGFDLSYIRFRDQYLQVMPQLTIWYGATFKGIEPERSTAAYLAAVDRLQNQVAETGLQSAQSQAILRELRDRSITLINENPFEAADKSGSWEWIKSEMRSRVGSESSTNAFLRFWSQPYLSQRGWSQEMAFFDQTIRPEIASNFYRGIAFDGSPIDLFWRIDLWFIGIFAAELLARSLYLSRRYKNVSLLDAALWRWYDLLLVVPFSALRLPALALSRVVPVLVRLNQSKLVNLEPARERVNRFLISQVAIELTEVIVLRVIDQLQNSIRRGEAARWVLDSGERRYIDLNGVNELQVISDRLSTVLIHEVLPQVKPEIDALLDHHVTRALDQAPGYRGLRQLPGVGNTAEALTRQIVEQVTENLFQALQRTSKDDRGTELLSDLLTRLTNALRTEVKQTEGAVEELQTMTVDLLEEVKLNYVRRLAAEDYEALAEERYRLYDATQRQQP